jgi:hypothetical protein
MSTRGINFLDKWMAEHLPDAMTADPVAISDLADEAMWAADREGNSRRRNQRRSLERARGHIRCHAASRRRLGRLIGAAI